MVWRSGEYTKQNGRTVRSSFSTRKEGILVLKETFEGGKSDAEEIRTNEIVYSLGKQNRWMIPELVKDSNLRSNFGDEDILFVERENAMDERTPRADCTSVYESASGNVFQPRRKYGQIDSLVERANKTRVVYEVTYPNTQRKGPFNLNSQKTPRKKYNGKKRSHKEHFNEREWQQLSEDLLDEDDFAIDYSDEDDSITKHTVSFGDFLCGPPQKIVKVKNSSIIDKSDNTKSNSSKELHLALPSKSKVVFIDDEEMISQHEKMYKLSRKTDSLLRKIFWQPYYWVDYTRKRKYYRKILKKVQSEDQNDKSHEIQDKDSQVMSKKSKSTEYPYCPVNLWNHDLEESDLRVTWGDLYLEGASSPRKFSINLTNMENCLSNITGLSSAFLLFEINNGGHETINHSQASIKLLLDGELSDLINTEETANLIIGDFFDFVKKCSDVMEVKKVVELAMQCFKKHTEENCTKHVVGHISKPLSLNLYERIWGWKGQPYTEKEVFEETRNEILKRKEDSLMQSQSANQSTECGICFDDLSVKGERPFTTMNSCHHSFCNNCWESYLEAKLSAGQVNVFCPGHSCKTVVDLVTVMSVAPCLYGKYLSWKVKRAIASNPCLKNCPNDKCGLVCKVSSYNSGHSMAIPSGLPVSCCCCKSIWCYNCQEQAHWPAPCDDAQKFREANKGYAKAENGTKLPEISTVSIKKCPNCHYPIEKFEGCSNMYCIMCNKSFCWWCVKLLENEDGFDYNHQCENTKREVPSTVMDISSSLSNIQRLADLAVVSFYAVKSGMSVKTHQKLKSMEQGLEAYLSLKNLSKKYATSRTGLILESTIAHNITPVLKEAYCFEFQAHIALEGMLICLVSDMSDRILHDLCMRLLLIMEKLRTILKNTDFLYKERNVADLNELIKNGQKCLVDLRRHVEKNPK